MYWKMLKNETYSRRGNRYFSTCPPRADPEGRQERQESSRAPARASPSAAPCPRRARTSAGACPARRSPWSTTCAPLTRRPRRTSTRAPSPRRRGSTASSPVPRRRCPSAACAGTGLIAQLAHSAEDGDAPARSTAATRRTPGPVPWNRDWRCSSRRSPSPSPLMTWDRPNSGATASRPSRISAFGTPSSRATDSAPSAFARLCGPKSGKRIRNPSQWMSVPPSPMLSLPSKPGVLPGPNTIIFPRTPSARKAW